MVTFLVWCMDTSMICNGPCTITKKVTLYGNLFGMVHGYLNVVTCNIDQPSF